MSKDTVIGLDGQSYLEVSINGRAIPLAHLRFQKIMISAHMLYHCPMGQLEFTDPYGVMAKSITPTDGTDIVIKMGRTTAKVKTYKFRTFNVKIMPTPQGTAYSIPFISPYDAWRMKDSVNGGNYTSAEALKKLADDSGLTFKGDATNDKQIWLPVREPYCKFARRIASAGWVDDSSCMMMGVTLAGELRYINLDKVNFKGKLPTFMQGVEGGIWVTSWGLSSTSGSHNQTGGYNTTTTQYDPSLDKIVEVSKIKVTRISSAALDINSDVKPKVGGGKSHILPIDGGNNHANYAKAIHQNIRISRLLSQALNIITPLDSGVEIFDAVNFENYITNQHGVVATKDVMTSGPYISAGKTIQISGDLQYCERLQLLRQGWSGDNSGKTS